MSLIFKTFRNNAPGITPSVTGALDNYLKNRNRYFSDFTGLYIDSILALISLESKKLENLFFPFEVIPCIKN